MLFENYYTYGSLIMMMFPVEYVWDQKLDGLRKVRERVWVRQVIGCDENGNERTCSIEGRELNE